MTGYVYDDGLKGFTFVCFEEWLSYVLMKRKVKQETEYSWKCVYEGKSRNNYNYPLLTGMHVCKKDFKKNKW